VSLGAARARQLELSAAQLAAVAAPPGPLLILAGPGSGKTLTLSHRAAHLIAAGLVRPEHVLAITFTTRAAEELAVHLRGLVGLEAAGLLTVGTFHTVSHRMLRLFAERGHAMALGLELLEALEVTTVEGGAPAAGRTAVEASCDHAPRASAFSGRSRGCGVQPGDRRSTGRGAS
jgi:DNA helicase-2/ATP-dependent DNA helicase PcrA